MFKGQVSLKQNLKTELNFCNGPYIVHELFITDLLALFRKVRYTYNICINYKNGKLVLVSRDSLPGTKYELTGIVTDVFPYTIYLCLIVARE